MDFTVDELSELNIKTDATHYIYKYEEDTLFLWNHWSINQWSSQYWMLNDGVILFINYSKNGHHRGEAYWCGRLNSVGEVFYVEHFSRNKDYETKNYNEKDDYFIQGQECTMEEWVAKAEEYLYIDENGTVQVKNQVGWKELF